ncbi:MAG: SemiSWEET transporter [Gammaproteobacteria bacterium]|jgi:MtN3 and saliva related transmembrane protein
MNYIELIGFAAASLTTFSFLPQAIKIYNTRSTKDISLLTFLTTTCGIALWLTYGILINSYPLIASNIISFSLAASILSFKIRYG